MIKTLKFNRRHAAQPEKTTNRKKMKWGVAALCAVFALGGAYTVVPAEQVQAKAAYQTAYVKATTDKQQFMTKVVYLVNLERRKAGLRPLTVDAKTSGASRLKATDMSKNRYFNHTSPTYGSPFNLLKLQKISYRAAGENIAMGHLSPESVMKGWMNSEGHRRNILNPNFKSIGVAYYNGYWVQLFVG